MALNRTRLANIQYIANSAGAIYTNGSSTKTYIRGFVIYNGNTTAEAVKLYNVPNSTGSVGTAGVSNLFYSQSIAADETVIISFPYPVVLIDTNDTIQAVTTTASKVTVQILGDKDA